MRALPCVSLRVVVYALVLVSLSMGWAGGGSPSPPDGTDAPPITEPATSSTTSGSFSGTLTLEETTGFRNNGIVHIDAGSGAVKGRLRGFDADRHAGGNLSEQGTALAAEQARTLATISDLWIQYIYNAIIRQAEVNLQALNNARVQAICGEGRDRGDGWLVCP